MIARACDDSVCCGVLTRQQLLVESFGNGPSIVHVVGMSKDLPLVYRLAGKHHATVASNNRHNNVGALRVERGREHGKSGRFVLPHIAIGGVQKFQRSFRQRVQINRWIAALRRCARYHVSHTCVLDHLYAVLVPGEVHRDTELLQQSGEPLIESRGGRRAVWTRGVHRVVALDHYKGRTLLLGTLQLVLEPRPLLLRCVDLHPGQWVHAAVVALNGGACENHSVERDEGCDLALA